MQKKYVLLTLLLLFLSIFAFVPSKVRAQIATEEISSIPEGGCGCYCNWSECNLSVYCGGANPYYFVGAHSSHRGNCTDESECWDILNEEHVLCGKCFYGFTDKKPKPPVLFGYCVASCE